MFTVYIMHSRTLDRHYVGMTSDLNRRVKEHREGRTHSVPASIDWTVVWNMPVGSAEAARELEKRVKGRGAGRFLRDRGVV